MASSFAAGRVTGRMIQLGVMALAFAHGQQLTAAQPHALREILGLTVVFVAAAACALAVRRKIGAWALASWLTDALALISQYIGVIVVMVLNQWARTWLSSEPWTYLTALRHLSPFVALVALSKGLHRFFYGIDGGE